MRILVLISPQYYLQHLKRSAHEFKNEAKEPKNVREEEVLFKELEGKALSDHSLSKVSNFTQVGQDTQLNTRCSHTQYMFFFLHSGALALQADRLLLRVIPLLTVSTGKRSFFEVYGLF